MPQTGIILIAALGAVFLLVVLVWLFRAWRFRPTQDKVKQINQLNEDLAATGFAYNGKKDYFYSLRNCWQRSAGYCSLYDQGSPFFNMIMDCEPITFEYDGKRWLIELWKGQYGITTGAEIGIYYTDQPDIESEKFTGTFYHAIPDERQMRMSFTLRKNGAVLLSRSALHWWLTAFKLGEFSETNELTMTAKITFPTRAMLRAFIEALRGVGYTQEEYSVRFRTVTILFQSPHTPQPITQEGLQEDVVQGLNKNNCALFHAATASYPDTADKLEYIKSFAPELYEFMLNSLYAKGFFAAFDWILDLITPNPPEPTPTPKPPCPPTPEPVCTPSLPADAETAERERERLEEEGILVQAEDNTESGGA